MTRHMFNNLVPPKMHCLLLTNNQGEFLKGSSVEEVDLNQIWLKIGNLST